MTYPPCSARPLVPAAASSALSATSPQLLTRLDDTKDTAHTASPQATVALSTLAPSPLAPSRAGKPRIHPMIRAKPDKRCSAGYGSGARPSRRAAALGRRLEGRGGDGHPQPAGPHASLLPCVWFGPSRGAGTGPQRRGSRAGRTPRPAGPPGPVRPGRRGAPFGTGSPEHRGGRSAPWPARVSPPTPSPRCSPGPQRPRPSPPGGAPRHTGAARGGAAGCERQARRPISRARRQGGVTRAPRWAELRRAGPKGGAEGGTPAGGRELA